MSGPIVFNAAGLAIKQGGASPQFSTAKRVRYAINGNIYGVDPQTALSLPSTPVLGTNASVVFVVQVDANGNITAVGGGVGAGPNAPMPVPSAGNAALGFIWVRTNGSVTFTPGVTNLDDPGVTAEYVDSVGLPWWKMPYPRLPTAPWVSAAVLDTNPTPPVFNPQNF
ncbi:MAG: hypothetical protein KGL39_06615 [Patescibacteria group bacterium]|nr:hypothetical protein [Patescibacteria group bacterium]